MENWVNFIEELNANFGFDASLISTLPCVPSILPGTPGLCRCLLVGNFLSCEGTGQGSSAGDETRRAESPELHTSLGLTQPSTLPLRRTDG